MGSGIAIRPMKSSDRGYSDGVRKWVIEEGVLELDILKYIKR